MINIGDKYNKLIVCGIATSTNGEHNYVCICDECGKKSSLTENELLHNIHPKCCGNEEYVETDYELEPVAINVKPEIKVQVRQYTTWEDVHEDACDTINRSPVKTPPAKWRKRILLAEHSPIRNLEFKIKMKNIPYSTSVHIVRHFTGITHFVGTQRTDRCDGINRGELPQDMPVNHSMILNAQSLIFISRRRLCNQASAMTHKVWKMVIEKINEICPELGSVCVPECIYRGFCPEFKCCGYVNTEKYAKELEKYRDVSCIS